MSSVEERIHAIRQRIAAAADRAGRPVASITLVGASKRQSLDRMQAAWDAGLRVFGENRVQEALEKQPQLPPDAEWHLIGPLQSNKAKRAATAFRMVHSIDRPKIAQALDRHAAEAGCVLDGLLEVNLGEEVTKHGFEPGSLVEQAKALADLEHLRIVGLMAIPPFEQDPEAARGWFRKLRHLRDELFSSGAWSDRPGYLSMGMSHDFETAILEGATHVRVGTSLFGERPPLAAP
jgi:pyridoxal phosphate enzyme (YggS family)